jgi:transcriptional regulator with XRE-family HTH domain
MKALETSAISHANNRRIADAVRAELARRRLSQAELARQLGYTKPRLWRRMTGRIPFTVAELEAIASVLGCPLERLWKP